MTRAVTLANLVAEDILTVDNVTDRVGISTTTPSAQFQVGTGVSVYGNSGIVSATKFYGDGSNLTGVTATTATTATTAQGLTGTPDITVRNIIGVAATLTGVLTYEDVTNIDSLGIITARSGVSIADSIFHTGDTNTAIRFPAADTFTVETGGVERTRITSDGNVRVPDNGKFTCGAGDDLKIYHNGSVNYIAGDEIRVVNNAVSESMAKFIADGAVELYHNDSKKLETTTSGITVTGTVSDSIGPLRRLGTNIKTTDYTLVAADAGKMVRVDNGSTITVPDNTFSDGDMVTIVSGSSSAVPITEGSGVTLYNASDGTDGSVTLAARTACTILVADGGSSSKIYIAGGGIS